MGRFCTAALLALAPLLLAAGAAQAAPCRLMRIASFDLKANANALVVVPVTLNGTPEKFLLDTGGVASTVSPAVVDALKLGTHGLSRYTEVYAADGSMFTRYTTVDRMGIGAVAAPNVKLLVQPDSTRVGIENFRGTLAPDMLRNFDLDFDFAGGKLNLFSPDHCKGKVVYWARAYAAVPFSLVRGSEHILVPVTLDGHRFTAVVDTGASDTVLRAGAGRSYFDLDPGEPGIEPMPGASADALIRYRKRFQRLDLEGISVKNPMIAIMPDDEEKAFWKRHSSKSERDPVYGLQFNPEPIVLGMNVLTKLHLYIAYGEKTLYVTAADAGHTAPAATASGATSRGAH